MATAPNSTKELSDPGAFRFIDIGVNLTDPIFRGWHHGKKKHEDDFAAMLERARAAGIKSMIITGGSLTESKEALELAKQHGLYATVGCHPTRSSEFDKHDGGPEAYLAALDQVVAQHLTGPGRVAAIGECGLDYDRLHFAPKDVQKRHFRTQLSLAKKHHLPLFLHSRSAHTDFVAILRDEGLGVDGGKGVGGKGGVVHSFTGTIEEAKELTDMGFYVSVNGCGLKTEENVSAAKSIRLDRLLLETDAPWCSLTSTHASKKHLDTLPASLRAVYIPPGTKAENFSSGKPVKGRNESTVIGAVAWTIYKARNDVSFQELVDSTFTNTVELFGLDELR